MPPKKKKSAPPKSAPKKRAAPKPKATPAAPAAAVSKRPEESPASKQKVPVPSTTAAVKLHSLFAGAALVSGSSPLNDQATMEDEVAAAAARMPNVLHALYLVARLRKVQVRAPWRDGSCSVPPSPIRPQLVSSTNASASPAKGTIDSSHCLVADARYCESVGNSVQGLVTLDTLAQVAVVFPTYIALEWKFTGAGEPRAELVFLRDEIPSVASLAAEAPSSAAVQATVRSVRAPIACAAQKTESLASRVAKVVEATHRDRMALLEGSPSRCGGGTKRPREGEDETSQSHASNIAAENLPAELLAMLPEAKKLEVCAAIREQNEGRSRRQAESMHKRVRLEKLVSLFDLIRSVMGGRATIGGGRMIELLASQNRHADDPTAVAAQLAELISFGESGLSLVSPSGAAVAVPTGVASAVSPKDAESTIASSFVRYDANSASHSSLQAAVAAKLDVSTT